MPLYNIFLNINSGRRQHFVPISQELFVADVGDIKQCIMNLKHNKAGGYDGVVNEHLIFSEGDGRAIWLKTTTVVHGV